MKSPVQPQTAPNLDINDETIGRRQNQGSTSISSEGERVGGLASEAEDAQLAVVLGEDDARFITLGSQGEIVDKVQNDFEEGELTLTLTRGEKGLSGRITKLAPAEKPGDDRASQPKDPSQPAAPTMQQNASQPDYQSFRNFIGISALTSVAFMVLFGVLFTNGAISSTAMAISGVLLLLATVGFARLWYDLGH